jgi:hypothetical protein
LNISFKSKSTSKQDDNSRSNSFEERGNDENHQAISHNLLHVSIGPVTRSSDKKIKELFNRIIQDI